MAFILANKEWKKAITDVETDFVHGELNWTELYSWKHHQDMQKLKKRCPDKQI